MPDSSALKPPFGKLHEIAKTADAVMRLDYPCRCYQPGCAHERLMKLLRWFDKVLVGVPPTVTTDDNVASFRSPNSCPATVELAKTSDTHKSTTGTWSSTPVACGLERGHDGVHVGLVAWE